ncbi:MAG: 1-acyl-sn-glycerol-3-phosphate acyltransferase [Acidobacteriota bacterium]|nr:1-acyl-sn-glycerol-3-phosphate acyltransferase [Acidobacteriota bacterium]
MSGQHVHPLASVIAAVARGISGVQVRWQGCTPDAKQRIYFANHTSHLDFAVLWSALPGEVRARTRPVAAKDYWDKGVRAYLAQRVFRAVLIPRRREAGNGFAAANVIDELAAAMGTTNSLIFFPEGTRGDGETMSPFRSGLYYLAKQRPDVELVPVYLENLSRILPKGEVLPVPLASLLTFGEPMQLGAAEEKVEFLQRAWAAVAGLRRKVQV